MGPILQPTKTARLTRFGAQIEWGTSKPDGQPRRSSTRSEPSIASGFKAETGLDTGLSKTIEWWEHTENRKTASAPPASSPPRW
jgi:hypothetical protein